MDKWFNNKWFIRGISIVIAVMLYLMVSIDNVNQQPGGIPGITDGHRVLEEVELQVYYNDEDYVVSDAPETVEVNVRGPQNLLTILQFRSPQYEVFIDLRGKEPGEHYERVQHRGFSNDLNISVMPMTVSVTLEEKQTASFPVEIELLNEEEIGADYTIGEPSVDPSSVEVTAAESLINQIAYARTFVDIGGETDTVSESADVVLFDAYGNEVQLETNPSEVDVEIPINSTPRKEVPVNIGGEGTLPNGSAVASIEASPETVTLFGPSSVLNGISSIDDLSIDLSDITEDTSIELDVPVPEGVERVEPETITVDVQIEEEETRTFGNFPFEIIGLEEGKEVELVAPENTYFDLQVLGAPSILRNLGRDDIDAFIDLEGLDEGEHEVPLVLNGPRNLRFNQSLNEVQVIVYDEEEEEIQSSSVEESTEPEDEVTEPEDEEESSEAETEEEMEEEMEEEIEEQPEDEEEAEETEEEDTTSSIHRTPHWI
ncbi:CdaR family protein [Alteribacter keqinensis]|uniref:YbbR-like domain-containing protein n=1 Tax=Alteribacter keqinensis TaxID=2483800 RepID=A0A3M7TM36_9BACI|nr:CdaR family protein [Alteribacter keqinensis]RNA66250.1 YbbR-like domain-containing protein [Alteribacter keqinensis]